MTGAKLTLNSATPKIFWRKISLFYDCCDMVLIIPSGRVFPLSSTEGVTILFFES